MRMIRTRGNWMALLFSCTYCSVMSCQVSEQNTRYFSALNWTGAYTGVQNNAPGSSLEPSGT